jgi:AraC-like DNA-binding protein
MAPNYAPTHYSNLGLYTVLGGHKPPNMHQWGPGVRDVYALHYIVSGKGVLETRNTTFSLRAGESFIIFPETEVYYYPDEQEPWEYVWIEFKGSEVQRLLMMTELNIDRPVVSVAPTDLRLFYDMDWENETQAFSRLRRDAQLRLLLSYYLQYYPQSSSAPLTDYVQFTKQYIAHNYWRATLTVANIVAAVRIDRSHLFRLFKEATGMSISSYVTAYRIQRACELLQSPDLSIKSIAYSVGYPDQLYFSKVFKKATAYTPSAYRLLS